MKLIDRGYKRAFVCRFQPRGISNEGKVLLDLLYLGIQIGFPAVELIDCAYCLFCMRRRVY